MYLNRSEREHTGWSVPPPLATLDPQGSYLLHNADAGPWARLRPQSVAEDFGENSGAAGVGRGRLRHLCLPSISRAPWGLTVADTINALGVYPGRVCIV
jgi:hypothetical protein